MAIMTHQCAVSTSQAVASGEVIDVTIGSYTDFGLDLWGFQDGFLGSRSPTTVGGKTITVALWNGAGSDSFTITIQGSPADDFWDNVDVEHGAGVTNLASADASISGTTDKTWTFTAPGFDWSVSPPSPAALTFYLT